ncbi:putative chromatin regulatory protein sir2 protein [Botrytis fragariae]|uniref:Putative chromatin regulatory protein sir2 protein n=1 Tax=Botrytis fragariae TaxID=1964551 RepID=A0A8H6EF71_9HELO|nr:putative chromatin regulatory protein sir2 protein [Botrytis fragariae]KAF5870134.1 putative chromatin regulatory protein sir2 protein [Botrytis fragariae]
MSSATLNGVGSTLKMSSSKVIDLVSDEENSEIDDAALHGVVRDSSRGLPQHHQNAASEDLEAALDANENSVGDEFEEEEEDDDDGEDDDDSIDSSLMEDTVEALTNDDILDNHSDPERCTRKESEHYRNLLRKLGPREFCAVTVEADAITAKKLLTAFGVLPPMHLEGLPDEEYYQFLSFAIRRELQKRIKIPTYNTVDDAIDLIRHAKKIIVITGAGISTSLGIPDFRSANGLYAQFGHLNLDDPQEIFNINKFKEDPSIFFGVAKAILPEIVRYSPTHQFIALLQRKGKLLTNYTQNIDNIEDLAGIIPEKVIHCHGSFATATCQVCGHQVEGEKIFDEIKAGKIPRCKRANCPPSSQSTRKRKRISVGGKKKKNGQYSDDNESDDIPEPGIMKPDITFFGENLPDVFSDRLSKHDRDQVDLVITIGTSLKVAPVSEVVPYLPSHVPQIQINRDPIGHLAFDIDLVGECDVVVSKICKELGWELKHSMIPKDQEIEIKTSPNYPHRHDFKQTHPKPEPAPASTPTSSKT